MDYNLKKIINFLPEESKVSNIGKVVSTILSFLVYMKDGDRIIIPGITIEKSDNLFSIESEISPTDMIKTLEENSLLSGNEKIISKGENYGS